MVYFRFMSVYQFLKSIEFNNQKEKETEDFNPETDQEVTSLPSLFFILCSLFFVGVIYYLFVYRRRTVVLNFIFNIQNYFHNPVFQRVNIYHGDQRVPDNS